MKNFVKFIIVGTAGYLIGKSVTPRIIVEVIVKDGKPA